MDEILNLSTWRVWLRTYAPDANPQLVINKTGLADAAAIEAALAAIAASVLAVEQLQLT